MAREKKPEEKADLDGWITSYGDVMSLLLVFFIVMFAMANTDVQKFSAVAEALRSAFSGIGAQPVSGLISADGGGVSSAGLASAPIMLNTLPARQRDFVRVSTEMATLADKLGIQSDIDVNMSMEGMVISLSDELAFEPGSADLRPEATKVLDTVAKVLSETESKLRVEGNTDDIPTNSPLYPSNWELSVARAVSIVRYLAEEGDIDPTRLSAAGNAEFNPLMPNDSRANRAKNRRADIVIIYPSGERHFSVSPVDVLVGSEGETSAGQTITQTQSTP